MKTAFIGLGALFVLAGCSSNGLMTDKQMDSYNRFGEIYRDAREQFCAGNATKFYLSEYSIRIECQNGSDFTIKTPH